MQESVPHLGSSITQPVPPRRRFPLSALTTAILALLIGGGVTVALVLLLGGHDPGSSTGQGTVARTSARSAPSASSTSHVAPPPSPPTSPPTSSSAALSATARQQLAHMDALLAASSQTRGQVRRAVAAITDCSATSSDVAILRDAANARAAIVDQVGSLDVSAILGGTQLVSELTAAEQASHDADLSFADWGDSQLGCTSTAARTADYDDAVASSGIADDAKSAFVKDWNRLAAAAGLPPRSAASI
ncbi:MAG: hypothetical protein ACJ74O_15775 [Frankiaceae bacterium]